MQVIFSGDFYQLPPVGNKDEPETTKFCFESELWFQTFSLENHVNMNKIFRQSDPIYQRILNQVREGRLKRSSNEALLLNVGREIPPDSLIRPTKLFPTRNKVDYINVNEMNNIKTKEYEFKVKYHADLEMSPQERITRLGFTKEQIQTELMYIQGNLRCDEVVKLKIGAQVMCIVNIQLDNGDILCNGAQGIVVDISIQGSPVVKYKNGYQMTMNPHMWPSELIPGIGVSQVPIILAWALTIHKAQGSTLDIAEVDAGSGIFECGQTYVALSRVKSLEGLYLSSFDAKRIRINKKVQEFYEILEKNQKKEDAKNINIEETNKREIEKLPEAYVEAVIIPFVEVILVTEAIPIIEDIPIIEVISENTDFSQFEY
jgi:ATP-dependent DNA helicase PIF1